MKNKLNLVKYSFQIPLEISCLIKNNILFIKKNKKIYKFSSLYGQLKLKNNCIYLIVNKNIWDKKKFKSNNLELSNLLQGYSLGFTIKLIFKGVGYRILSKKKILTFKIGLNKPVSIIIPDEIKVYILDRTTFYLQSNNLRKLRNY